MKLLSQYGMLLLIPPILFIDYLYKHTEAKQLSVYFVVREIEEIPLEYHVVGTC